MVCVTLPHLLSLVGLVTILNLVLYIGTASGQRAFTPEQEKRKWTNAVVKIEWDGSVTLEDRTIFQEAFREFETKTCIRFQEKSPGDRYYTRLVRDDNGCGWHGGGCGTDGPQTTAFGGGCRSTSVMVHEFMHALCYPHAQHRSDRDDWLKYDQCPNPPPEKLSDWPVGESLFDYVSKVHDGCRQCTHGGWPTQNGVEKCGGDVSQTLSVMDADMINEYYDCQGCYRHRWRLWTSADRIPEQDLVPFGNLPNGAPTQICRGYWNGEVIVGKYWHQARTCWLSWGGEEHSLTSHFQILTIPGGQLEVDNSKYRMIHPRDAGKDGRKLVPACRKPNGSPGFAAVARFGEEYGIGKAWKEEDLAKATFPIDGREVETNDFLVLSCGPN